MQSDGAKAGWRAGDEQEVYGEEVCGQGRWGQKVKGASELTAPRTSLSLAVPIALSPLLSITFLSRDARSHYGGVRKGASRVASSSAWVTDCCSALVAEEARAVGDWLRWSGSGH